MISNKQLEIRNKMKLPNLNKNITFIPHCADSFSKKNK